MVLVVKRAPQGPVREATLRYGLVSAGLFLAALGALLSGGERPHVYGTFCVLGVILTAAGVAWSLCQWHPKVILSMIHEADSLPFLLDLETKPRAQQLQTPENAADERGEISPISSCSSPPALPNGSPPLTLRGTPTWVRRSKGVLAEEEEGLEAGCAVQVHSGEPGAAPRDPSSPGSPPCYEDVLGGSGETTPHCPLCRGESEEDEEEDEEESGREEETNFGSLLREAESLARNIDADLDADLDAERDAERDAVSLISETT